MARAPKPGDAKPAASAAAETPRPAVGTLEDWKAPEVFADDLVGLFTSDGCVYLTLGARRSEHTPGAAPEIRTVTCGRAVPTLKAAAKLRDQLSTTFARLEKQGVVRRAAEPQPTPSAPRDKTKVN